MNVRDGWATASIRIIGAESDLQRLPATLIDVGRFNKDRTVLLLPVGTDEDAPLQVLLGTVRSILAKYRAEFAAIGPEYSVEVSLGWSPRAPQEGVTMDAKLVQSIAQVGASVVIHTYSE